MIHLFFLALISFGSQAFSQNDIEVSNLALKEILVQNPTIEPTDTRDPKKKFTDLIASYLNPGIYTVFDEKTGEALTNFSYTTNACALFEKVDSKSTYNCSFAAGYVKSVLVDKYNKISLDMGQLLSNGMQVEYDFMIESDKPKQIFNSKYYTF